MTSIRNDKHLDRSQKMLNSLFAHEPLTSGEVEYLEALGDLIGVYEAQNIHFDEPSDAKVLAYLMELRSTSQVDLAAEIDMPKSTVSEVLSGKRTLTRQQIARLAKFFSVGQGVFAAPID